MSNLQRAIDWHRIGGKPFPCYEVDTWVGDNLHERKSPRTARGFYDAFDNEDDIRAYWTENPKHLVGIWCGPLIVVLDIDKKYKFDPVTGEEIAIDGQFHLDQNNVDVPPTFSVQTDGGGEHRFYRNPGVENLNGDVDIALANGVVLKGVDRRAGNSYFIAWSDSVPENLQDLPIAPDWLLVATRRAKLAEYSKQGRMWFEECPGGDPDTRVRQAINRIPTSEFNHKKMVDMQYELVKLATEGHPGVPEALWLLREAWLRDPWNEPKWVVRWNAALAGAIRKYGRLPEPLSDTDESLEREVELEVRRRKIQLEAELRLMSEGYDGSGLLTLEDLKDYQQDYLVDTFVPRTKGLTLLVAKRNLGKTFAYLSMVLCMVFGMPWMGKKTERTKVLIVLGEGANGFYDRIAAWCEYWGKPVSEVEKSVFFLNGANLGHQVSLKRIEEVVLEKEIGLIVLDTWAATSGVIDEDKAAITSIALSRLQQSIGDTSVIIVHHPNKSTENSSRPSARGSTALEGRADVVVTLTSDTGYKSRGGLEKNWIQVSTEQEHGGKNRGARLETIRGAYLEPTPIAAVWLFDNSSLIARGSSIVRQKLVGSMSAREFSAAIDKSIETARRHLNQALEDGVVSKDVSARANEPAKYRLTWDEMLRDTKER